MITKLVLRNFKSIKEQAYDLTDFDLLVGRNNCGKSTILQALAIWQFCVNSSIGPKEPGRRGSRSFCPISQPFQFRNLICSGMKKWIVVIRSKTVRGRRTIFSLRLK